MVLGLHELHDLVHQVDALHAVLAKLNDVYELLVPKAHRDRAVVPLHVREVVLPYAYFALYLRHERDLVNDKLLLLVSLLALLKFQLQLVLVNRAHELLLAQHVVHVHDLLGAAGDQVVSVRVDCDRLQRGRELKLRMYLRVRRSPLDLRVRYLDQRVQKFVWQHDNKVE